MTHLTVREWGRIGVHDGSGPKPGNTYSRSEADVLLHAAWKHPLANGPGTNILVNGRNELIAQQVVGVIAAPGCSLEILPKIDNATDEKDETVRARLVSMLDVALGLELGHGQALAMARQNHTLLDILIRLFADRLLAEARRGLPRAYLSRQEDLPALRGRLDVVRQFTHHAVRPDRLACRFDSLAPDTPLLRIMKACVSMLRRHARTLATQRRLDELRFLLAEVSDVPVTALPWSDVRIDRTNHRWEMLCELAKLFLKRKWQRTDHDAKAGQGITLLFAMNDLFEAYIATLARRALRNGPLAVRSQGGFLSCLVEEDVGRHCFRTKPDVLIERNGETVMLIDTKWKLIGRNPEDRNRGVSQSDIYQMMAYARLYACRDIMLLYPHHVALGHKALDIRYTMQNGGERLRVASVDLLPGEAAVLQRLTELLSPAMRQAVAEA